jgi:hypothetical protein
VQLLFSDPLSTVLTAGLALALLAAVARVAWRSRSLELSFGAAVVAGLLASPHVLVHDLTLLLIPVAIVIRHRAGGPDHLGPLLSLGYVASLAGIGLVSIVPLQLSVVAMAALGLWTWLAAERSSASDIMAPVAAEPVPA